MAIALTIAGSDSGGGAGIQADLKTFSALGVYGASVLTAITAQNTRAVTRVEGVSPQMIRAQIEAVFDDLNIGAVKIGMLGTAAATRAVAEALEGRRLPLVLDPVMIAKSGDRLIEDDAIAALRELLMPRATVLTPNLPEAARLLGRTVAGDTTEAEAQGRTLAALGSKWVLMKGGHAEGETCTDLLVGPETRTFTAPRIRTKNSHGTGCSLSSAIAAGLALGRPVPEAVERAHQWLQGAIAAADSLRVGSGHGPVHHFHEWWTA
ncbi:bifunctional hydroxymethylpyrimidine kinase/phosphomethylpyrimidine kinase [Paracoccus sp. MC1862]|uniref:bifunctional hydroxymethylpyrimidine kinase/phosphomethylpyrimidine kinase n=1 Tax=Paracoccus sp. MC1862 TaxID=2760307 RepID=UPI00160416C8|nr:bifunctional hydroxymethylpyrimidine kinase/phosphomethylpyrimidine kinase [Paracoccus sp. MC1862]MBB1499203.1 bifunctional hydroxymethylpyrimidine kinase/phosphomethylpyrimidine kinase [Paracoccus sp. MC1862]QQO45017.1 bifunctional hydroxymethylpyrimidine kinase/phosphomethylpyrimidine kinase [Paracoccus sp. MC1862]